MGVHENIDIDKFPPQGPMLHTTVDVCFNFNPYDTLTGVVVRDDLESPHLTIIKLNERKDSRYDEPRFVLSTECQYRPHREGFTTEVSNGGT